MVSWAGGETVNLHLLRCIQESVRSVFLLPEGFFSRKRLMTGRRELFCGYRSVFFRGCSISVIFHASREWFYRQIPIFAEIAAPCAMVSDGRFGMEWLYMSALFAFVSALTACSFFNESFVRYQPTS